MSIDLRVWAFIVVVLSVSTVLLNLFGGQLEALLRLVPEAVTIAATGWLGLSLVRNTINPFKVRLSSFIGDPKYREKAGFFEAFRDDFAEIVRAVQRFEAKLRRKAVKHGMPALPNEEEGVPGRLVIFIDDLDRCAPDSIDCR